MTNSEATDWAQKWEACGMWNVETMERNVVRMVRPERKEEPMEGQLSFDLHDT